MLLTLLSEIATASWDAEQLKYDPQYRVSHNCSSFSQGFVSYTVVPPQVSPTLTTKILNFLMKLKPNITLKAGLRAISKHQKEPEDSPSEEVLAKIDSSIELIIHYFSASNWTETYSIVYSRLQATANSTSNSHTDSDLVPGIELYGILYLDANRAEKVLKDFYTYGVKMKLPLHRLLVEHFLQRSLIYWILSHHEEYSSIANSPDLVKAASVLFDYIYSCTEDEKRRKSSWRFLGTLITFIPSAFQIFEASFLPAATDTSSSLTPRASFSKDSASGSITSSKSSKGLASFASLKSKHATSNKLRALYSSANSGTSTSQDSKSQPKFNKVVQKKINFLKSLSKLETLTPANSLFLPTIIACIEIAKAAALVYINHQDSSLVKYAQALHPGLFSSLFSQKPLLDSHNSSITPLLYDYQCAFVTSYSVISPDCIIQDVYPLLDSNQPLILTYVPSIFQGSIDMRLMVSLLVTQFYASFFFFL